MPAQPAGTNKPGDSSLPQAEGHGLRRLLRLLAPLNFETRSVELFNLLLPGECRICLARLDHARRLPVCRGCLDAVAAPAQTSCSRCGKGSWTEVCGGCRVAPPAYEGARSVASYDGPARELIHLLKYGGVRPVAGYWSARLATAAVAWPEAWQVVVPVPLSRSRQRQRGFNQSAAIARGLAQRLHLPYDERALRRVRDTQSQAGLTGEERRRNLAGAFRGEARRVSGLRVLLVDDVLTTGATAHAAAAALKAAGAASVHVLTAARADLESPSVVSAPAALGVAS